MQRIVKRVSADRARAAAVAARIVRYCNVCNAETIRPRAWICSHCGGLLHKHGGMNGAEYLQALNRYVDTTDNSAQPLEREYINSPIDPGLDSLLSQIMADDIRLAVAIAQRRQDVERFYMAGKLTAVTMREDR